MRRIVVANVEGRSRVVSDGSPPRSRGARHTQGLSNTLVWATDAPVSLGRVEDTTATARTFVPGPGSTSLLWLTLPPLSVFSDPHRDSAAAELEHGLISPGIHDLMEADNPGWHTTLTVDYDYVVEGTLTLALTDGEVEVTAGDLVIQHGTRHAWRNRSDAVATLLVVLLGASAG